MKTVYRVKVFIEEENEWYPAIVLDTYDEAKLWLDKYKQHMPNRLFEIVEGEEKI
jgi:hypothetical protein